VTFLLIVYERKGTSGGGNSPRSSVEMGKKQTVYTCLHSYTHLLDGPTKLLPCPCLCFTGLLHLLDQCSAMVTCNIHAVYRGFMG
jgi:hypothetical protein